MEDLRKVLQEAYEERAELDKEIAAAEYEARGAAQRYQNWEHGFLYKKMFKRAFATRKEAHENAQAKREELHEQLRLTTLATEIDIDREQAEPYYKMRDDFAALSECQKTWDTLERSAINRVVERSAASESINREPVSFALNFSDLIQWEQKVPHLPNRVGGDLYIYPGFILYRASQQAFALIDSGEVTLAFRPQRFIEEQGVPSDTKVVGQAWAKSNKDGSPDRRFHDNYQIPVVIYGVLTFTSPSGLHEEYQCSHLELTERFAKAWNSFQGSFSTSERSAETVRPEETRAIPDGHADVTTPHTGGHQDPATAFAKESDKARTLALEHGQFWEYLLTEELLRSKISLLQKAYDHFEEALLLRPKRIFGARDYIHWLGQKMEEPTSCVQRIVRCLEQDLPVAWGKPGEPGDAIQILNVANGITNCCTASFNWELEMCSAEPPEHFMRLGACLRGFTAGIISEASRLPDELARAVETAQSGTGPRKIHINLTFSSPPQITQFLAEMATVKKHPEWLNQ
jgi:hypothetical protein